MRPKGNIYISGKSPWKGETVFTLTPFTKFSYHFARLFGAGLLSFFIVELIFTFSPLVQEEVNYSLHQADYAQTNDTAIKIANADETAKIQKEADGYGVNSYFSVVIPKIDASANIIANVDTANKPEYIEALKNGVAHARGTYFPGQGRNIFLFSHSTDSPLNIARYNAVFFLLRKLETGDKITVYFADKKYEYEVTEKFTAEASDTSWLDASAEGEKLILMTCDPPGTTWRRLLVVAKPITN